MSTFGVWMEVPCERCSVPSEGMWTWKRCIPRAEFIKQLKRAKWKREGDGWICRACSYKDLPTDR